MSDKHQALVCSDVKILRDLKAEFNEAIILIYVHSEMNIEEYIREEQGKGSSSEYIQSRVKEYYKAHKNYVEHFNEYDKSLIYTGNERELMMQFARILGYSHKEFNQLEKGRIK